MAALAAGMRVGAAVAPGEPLKLPPDGQSPRVKIDVLPPESKRLALTQSQAEGDTPSGACACQHRCPARADVQDCGVPREAFRFLQGSVTTCLPDGNQTVAAKEIITSCSFG